MAPRARLAQDLPGILRDGKVSHICSTPALWRLLPPGCSWATFPALRVVALGGEPLPVALAEQWLPPQPEAGTDAVQAGRLLLNTYGVTEATVYQTAHRITSSAAILCGRPLPGVALVVAAREGAAGELFVGGAQLAHGYLNAPALTAAKFVDVDESPILSGAADAADGGDDGFRRWLSVGRWFRTGDLGRWVSTDPAGASVGNGLPQLQLLGRADRQIKLRGVRIELGEVESILLQCPMVAAVAVVLHGATPTDTNTTAGIEQVQSPPNAPTSTQTTIVCSVGHRLQEPGLWLSAQMCRQLVLRFSQVLQLPYSN